MLTRTDNYSHFRQLEVAGDSQAAGNGVQLTPAAASAAPTLAAVGDDTNIDLTIAAKGTGRVRPATGQQYLTTGAPVAAGAALTLTEALHNGKTILLDTAAGSTVTLPAASGSGMRFRFLVSVIATSNSHIVKVANSSDTMTGMLMAVSDDAGFPVKGYTADATAGADTITLNRTTTGSTVKGEWIEIEDYAANKWAVKGMTAATGTEATPFSATV